MNKRLMWYDYLLLAAAALVLLLWLLPVHAEALTYKELAAQFEEKNNLPPGLLQAICEIESNWRPTAIGKDGEIGLCQLKPQTLALFCPACNPEVLLNPYDNLHWAARYLRWLIKVLNTTDPATLAVAYNGGQGSPAARYLIKLEKAKNGHIRAVDP